MDISMVAYADGGLSGIWSKSATANKAVAAGQSQVC